MKIIMGAPPETGAFHGCPYRHSSDTQLLSQLQALKIGGNEVSDIVKLAKSSNYQLACQKHFDAVHPNWRGLNIKNGDGAANHPNQWFQASVEFHKAKSGVSSSAGAGPEAGVAHVSEADDLVQHTEISAADDESMLVQEE
jgi:DNA primase large subunit